MFKQFLQPLCSQGDLRAEKLLAVIEKHEKKAAQKIQKAMEEKADLSVVYEAIQSIEKAFHSEFAKALSEPQSIWQGKAEAEIEYVNAKKEHSRRKITVHGISVNAVGNVYLDSYCHLREETRSFLASGIVSAQFNGTVFESADNLVQALLNS